MSNYHKFTGLKNIYKNKESKAGFHLGEPCIYHDHYDTSLAWRDNETGACKICLESHQEAPQLRLDVGRLKNEHHSRAARFWSYITINDWDSCWKFNQPGKSGPNQFFWRRPQLVNRYTHHAHRVLTWLAWGDLGNCGTISLCGERRCCNPLHQIPAGLDPSILKTFPKEYLAEQLEIIKKQARAYDVQQRDFKLETDAREITTQTKTAQLAALHRPEIVSLDNLELFQQFIRLTQSQITKGLHITQKTAVSDKS